MEDFAATAALMLAAILLLLISGFAFGALARWAVPGPDPMPVWLTVMVGLGGSAIGGGITAAVLNVNSDNVSQADYFTIELASILTSILLVVGYRHFVQQRAIVGPDALKPPTRGFGIGARRANRPSFRDAVQKAQLLKALDELHTHGHLTDEEYQQKRAQILGADGPPGA
ncbi:MAG TPA: SHOCT domain-containing protein [Gaiellaceae bacterium]|nr:SHOCT domain-containing protein [Gaiellaceae bacterium]